MSKKAQAQYYASNFQKLLDKEGVLGNANGQEVGKALMKHEKLRQNIRGKAESLKTSDAKFIMQLENQLTENLAAFSETELNDGTETGGYIIRYGKIFEAGDYPDKNCSITPEELAEAVKKFQPVPIDYAHVPGPLDGKLGQWVSAKLSDDGKSVLGEVRLPKWLDAALEDTKRKVSATLDIDTKEFKALALVNKPRISDAALFTAFEAAQNETETTNSDTTNNNDTQLGVKSNTIQISKEATLMA